MTEDLVLSSWHKDLLKDAWRARKCAPKYDERISLESEIKTWLRKVKDLQFIKIIA